MTFSIMTHISVFVCVFFVCTSEKEEKKFLKLNTPNPENPPLVSQSGSVHFYKLCSFSTQLAATTHGNVLRASDLENSPQRVRKGSDPGVKLLSVCATLNPRVKVPQSQLSNQGQSLGGHQCITSSWQSSNSELPELGYLCRGSRCQPALN